MKTFELEFPNLVDKELTKENISVFTRDVSRLKELFVITINRAVETGDINTCITLEMMMNDLEL